MKKRDDGTIWYSPSDLIEFSESEFASWMDRFNEEHPDEQRCDPPDAALAILQNKGNEHELAFLSTLRQEDPSGVIEILNGGDTFADTVAALKKGARTIYQAELRHENFRGRADFLRRVEGESQLGAYRYEVWDTKLAKKPKPYFLIQLCCYAEMLEAIQGCLPEHVRVVLGNGETKAFRTHDYFYYYKQLKERFLAVQAAFDRNKQPLPDGFAEHRKWSGLAKRILEKADHVSLVANIRRTQIRKLDGVNITTLTDLALNSQCLQSIPRMEQATFENLQLQASLQLQSRGQDRPLHQVLRHEQDRRAGLALLPPKAELDVFFDMEGYPHIEGGLEYLFGVSYVQSGVPQFKDWWAHDRFEEKRAFEDFIDWIYDRWQRDPDMHVYHYADYEVSAIRRLMGRHATREAPVDSLLRAEVFVNLFTVVRQGIRVGTPSYSIKEVEHLYRESRSTSVATAMDSVVFYQNWLEHQDGQDWQSSPILKSIRDYNRDDCESTVALAQWLRIEQTKNRISWIPPKQKEHSEEKAEARNDTALLANELLSDLPEDRNQARVQTLLAHLLEFHWREARPIFWAMYDRHQMSPAQLRDDSDCLADMKRTTKSPFAPTPKARSLIYEYTFDTAQDTKIHDGSKCFFAHDLTRKCEVVEFDAERGRIAIQLGPTQVACGEPPAVLSLIPDEYVSSQPLADSIKRTVLQWRNNRSLPEPLKNFLFREAPRISGGSAGRIIAVDEQLDQGCIRAVKSLVRGTLCIQGPPGSGKTTTGARIIVELLQAGKRVGVTSNSHKAIANLLRAVDKQAQDYAFSGAKIQNDPQNFDLDGTSFVAKKNIRDVLSSADPAFQLIGGTAWAFSDPAAVGTLDYLFVDEAGQVSVANLVSMAPSTQNIIIMGDQMQLSQPIQGAHPGESGQSILDYLLHNQQTIADDFGIFLGTTYRMHPDICTFISSAVYEGKLHSADDTTQRRLVLPERKRQYISKPTGILYVPVEHHGNVQASDEEVQTIRQIIQELLACRLVDHGAEGPLTLEDILVVSPYNLQVRKLQQHHLRDRVGTVDKFQGQQAAVVIVSMCASDGNESPRGIEFLFNKNRLNVAISRARCLAIVVGSPALATTSASRVEHMELINLYCRIMQEGSTLKLPMKC